jgi:multiple sugar transport system ATP-binding protein
MRVLEAARTLQITHLLRSPVSSLSSGDRQRVALGRAIVRKPMAFMMDEPLGALDAEFRELMCGELRSLHDRLKATTVYVTHDQREAMSMADTIAIMNQGTVEQLGSPQEVYEWPASVFVADFVGAPAMNFLPFEAGFAVGDDQALLGGQTQAVPALREAVSARPLLLGVRPEHVRLLDAAPLRAQVLGTEYLGHNQVVVVETAHGARLRAKVSVRQQVARGDTVGLDFDAAEISLFDKASGRALQTARYDRPLTGNARHG